MTACCVLSVKNEFIFFPVKLFVYKGTQVKHQQNIVFYVLSSHAKQKKISRM